MMGRRFRCAFHCVYRLPCIFLVPSIATATDAGIVNSLNLKWIDPQINQWNNNIRLETWNGVGVGSIHKYATHYTFAESELDSKKWALPICTFQTYALKMVIQGSRDCSTSSNTSRAIYKHSEFSSTCSVSSLSLVSPSTTLTTTNLNN